MPVALITGGERGIGRAIVLALARAGMDVGFTWYFEEADAEAVRQEVLGLGRRASTTRLAMEEPGAARAAIDTLIGELGGVDVLVNSAADPGYGFALELDEAALRRVLEINVVGAFAAARRAAEAMIAAGRGGRIVNITSVHASTPLFRASGYTASKHALAGLTATWALEWAAHGITVNAVAPGATLIVPGATAADRVVGDLPLGRKGAPADVAGAVAYLASPQAGYVTGATIVVDGGLLLSGAPVNWKPLDLAAHAPPPRWRRAVARVGAAVRRSRRA